MRSFKVMLMAREKPNVMKFLVTCELCDGMVDQAVVDVPVVQAEPQFDRFEVVEDTTCISHMRLGEIAKMSYELHLLTESNVD